MSLTEQIQAWSPRREAITVMVGAFGYFLLGTACTLAGILPSVGITDRHLRFLLVYETFVLIALGGILRIRGWTARRLGLVPGLRDTVVGIGLSITNYLAYVLLWTLVIAMKLYPTGLHGARSLVDGKLTLPMVIGVSLLNPVFEEIFVCGYLITAARERGALTRGVNASVGIRLGYHLYQGGYGVVGLIPFGLIAALWFSRTGRLWPVVVMHAIADFAALVPHVG